MNTQRHIELQTARDRGIKSRQRLLVGHTSRASIDVHAQVHRSKSGEPYIQTGDAPRSGSTSGHVYVSDGASMLFWQQRTYRLVWDNSGR
jgi:hypothetical protein